MFVSGAVGHRDYVTVVGALSRKSSQVEALTRNVISALSTNARSAQFSASRLPCLPGSSPVWLYSCAGAAGRKVSENDN